MSSAVPQGYRRIDDHRVRENVGAGLHDFVVGQVIEHRPGRTVTETDHVMTLALTGNPAPIHSDVRFCWLLGRDRVLVCGMVTLGIVLGASIRTTSGLTTANLGLDELRLEHPVFVGDTLYAETEILQARQSQSRPEYGIVTCKISGFNQDHERVIAFQRTFFVPADAESVRHTTNY
ncbi:MaoC family dehydratase [Streptomyces sp. AC555_RSS877]|uniref:MaoC family dehydratase n=1 Tax=Streptomyces sp. AC555_RSS877 TaxID=2823688 RepID=UPI001C25305F|nr:MaoC family dehydratase [Streptomyces sp. AC555_RSS877]